MKLILFAFAAIAFSGSSKAKTRDEATPSEPEKPVPQTKPQPVPQPVVPIPEPAVELSAEEKANPVAAFDAMKTKVNGHKKTLTPLKKNVNDLENGLVNAKATAKEAKKTRENEAKSCAVIRELASPQTEKLKNDLKEREESLKQAKEAEEEANQHVKSLDTRVTEAQKAFNEVLDQMVAAEHELRSKGPLLVQKANEIAESKKQEAKKAGEAVAESKKALEKQRQIKANLENGKASFLSEAAKKAAMDDAEVNIAKKDSQRLKDEEALGVAQANGVNALKGAEYLEKERSVLAAFYDKFFSSNQNKKY